jgi:uncharacterized protein DUF6894
MARYYFHLRDGETILDGEGVDLPDLVAVRRAALATSTEILGSIKAGPAFWSGEPWTLRVTDGPNGGGQTCSLCNLRSPKLTCVLRNLRSPKLTCVLRKRREHPISARSWQRVGITQDMIKLLTKEVNESCVLQRCGAALPATIQSIF